MKILVNLPDEKLKAFSKVSGFSFISKDSAPDAESVYLVIDGLDYQNELNTSVEKDIPAVVIAGSHTDKQNISQARELGIPDACIIVKEDDVIRNLEQHIFGHSSRGIPVKTMTNICQYCLEQKLYPDLLIWQESNTIVEHTKDNNFTSNSGNTPAKKSVQDAPRDVLPLRNTANARVIEKNIDDFLTMSDKYLLVFRITPSVKSSSIAQRIAQELGAQHLEVGTNPTSFSEYSSDMTQAIAQGYAYCKDDRVSFSNQYMGSRWLVIEFGDLSNILLMNKVYELSPTVVLIPGTPQDSNQALESYGNNHLDAIIPDDYSFLSEYRRQHGNRVKTLEEFIEHRHLWDQ
jgi:hypothetical protein